MYIVGVGPGPSIINLFADCILFVSLKDSSYTHLNEIKLSVNICQSKHVKRRPGAHSSLILYPQACKYPRLEIPDLCLLQIGVRTDLASVLQIHKFCLPGVECDQKSHNFSQPTLICPHETCCMHDYNLHSQIFYPKLLPRPKNNSAYSFVSLAAILKLLWQSGQLLLANAFYPIVTFGTFLNFSHISINLTARELRD